MASRSLLLPVALLVSAPVFAQEGAAARPGTVDVPDFRCVSVGHGLKAEVKPGAKSVRLEGSAEDVARVKLEVKDGVLKTEVQKKGWFSDGVKGVRLHVTSPRVECLKASGGARIEAEATAADTFEAEASGGSQVRVSGVQTKKLDVEASGGSQLTLQGRTGEMTVEASGGSQIHAHEVQVESLQVEGSGGSQIEASATQSVQGELSGGSRLTSNTKPGSIQVTSSGGSQVRHP